MPHDLSPGRDLTSQHRIQGVSLSYIILIHLFYWEDRLPMPVLRVPMAPR